MRPPFQSCSRVSNIVCSMKLRVLSYNIHKGFTMSNKNFILEQIRLALREMNADVLFLQEVMGDHQHLNYRIPDWQTAIQFEYLADSVWGHFAYGKNAIYPEGHHGNAILSKFPISDWSNHVISNDKAEKRGLLKARIEIPGWGNLLLANTHLGLTQKGRDYQTNCIIEHMAPENLPWILVGDFNDWNSKVSPRIEKTLNAREVFHQLQGKYPATFPAILPLLSLDRIFLHQLTPTYAHSLRVRPWIRLSDHLPLYVEIELPERSSVN
jgi:endonuclease/exonuclease/phosphatase family metal-dependent hydrolase